MFRKPLFKEFTALSVILVVFHLLAIYFDLYWVVGEFDSLMHFLGGAWFVLGILWLYFFSGFFKPLNRQIRQYFLISMLGLVFISVVWEIYELAAGVAFVSWQEYPFDTTLDFIMDFLGGIAACFYAYMKEMRDSEPIKIKGQAPDNLPI